MGMFRMLWRHFLLLGFDQSKHKVSRESVRNTLIPGPSPVAGEGRVKEHSVKGRAVGEVGDRANRGELLAAGMRAIRSDLIRFEPNHESSCGILDVRRAFRLFRDAMADDLDWHC